MVMVAIVGLLSPAEIVRYARIDRSEMWVALVVAALGLTGGMLLGVAVGVALTLVLVVRNLNQPRVRPLYARPEGGWTTVAPSSIDETAHPGVLLLHLDGSLYTGNAQTTLDDVVGRAQADPSVHTVVLEGSRRPRRHGHDDRHLPLDAGRAGDRRHEPAADRVPAARPSR